LISQTDGKQRFPTVEALRRAVVSQGYVKCEKETGAGFFHSHFSLWICKAAEQEKVRFMRIAHSKKQLVLLLVPYEPLPLFSCSDGFKLSFPMSMLSKLLQM
jgi:hypothetical protein